VKAVPSGVAPGAALLLVVPSNNPAIIRSVKQNRFLMIPSILIARDKPQWMAIHYATDFAMLEKTSENSALMKTATLCGYRYRSTFYIEYK
jgi:hypothetical protein